jgi:hypothetical protein
MGLFLMFAVASHAYWNLDEGTRKIVAAKITATLSSEFELSK